MTAPAPNADMLFHDFLRGGRFDRPADLLAGFLGYAGPMFPGVQKKLADTLNSLRSDGAETLKPMDVLDGHLRLRPTWLAELDPPRQTDAVYFSVAGDDPAGREVLASEPNPFAKMGLPRNIRSSKPVRPALVLHSQRPEEVLVRPYTHMAVSPSRGVFHPALSARGLPRAMRDDVPTRPLDGPLFIARDHFPATNIAHILLDGVTRILMFCANIPADLVARTTILMGNPRDPFWVGLIPVLCDITDLRHDQFLFVDAPVRLQPNDQVMALSDAFLDRGHPALYGNPQILQVTRSAFARAGLERADGPRRIFVSRADARLRRILNEDALFAALEPLGFARVTLTGIPLCDQFALFANAEAVVAPHGAGLAHVLFCQPGTKVVELFHPDNGTDAFGQVACSIGLSYRFCVGQPTLTPRKGDRVPVDRLDYRIPPKKVVRILRNLGLED